jgi:hypothetical protein
MFQPPLKRTCPRLSRPRVRIDAYVVKVSRQGTAIVYAMFLNRAPRTQTTWFPTTTVQASTVDFPGNAYVTGITDDAYTGVWFYFLRRTSWG